MSYAEENFTSNCLGENFFSNGIRAVQIELPCECNLKRREKELISVPIPCRCNSAKDIKIQHVLPATWTKLNTLQLSLPLLNQPEFNSLEHILDQNWTTHFQGISLPNPKLSKYDLSLDPTTVHDIPSPRSYVTILTTWTIILSLVMLYTVTKLRILLLPCIFKLLKAQLLHEVTDSPSYSVLVLGLYILIGIALYDCIFKKTS